MMNLDDPIFKFDSPYTHSLAQVARIESTIRSTSSWRFREALDIANQLALQAHPYARSFIEWLMPRMDHPDVHAKLRDLLLICDATDQCQAIADTRTQKTLTEQLYSQDGFFFAKGKLRPDVLVVVFTTMYNNFGLSNLVLYSLLQAAGVSILMLRDGTKANYLGGARGMGNDLDSCAQAVVQFAAQQGCRQHLIMGYSSGGYASYFVSTRMPCAGYLGLSIVTDLSLDTTLPTDNFIDKAVRERFDSRYLVDLSTLPISGQPQVPRRLVVGDSAPVDVIFADRMAKVPGLAVIKVANCRHDTPEILLATGGWHQQIDWLLAQAH